MKYDQIGIFIKKKRQSLNISLNEFCFSNDIDPAILSRIENLKQNIKLNILEKIAKGFKQTPSELLSEFEKQIDFK